MPLVKSKSYPDEKPIELSEAEWERLRNGKWGDRFYEVPPVADPPEVKRDTVKKK